MEFCSLDRKIKQNRVIKKRKNEERITGQTEEAKIKEEGENKIKMKGSRSDCS